MRLFPSKNKNSTSDKVVHIFDCIINGVTSKYQRSKDTFHSMYDDGLVEIRFLLSKRWAKFKIQSQISQSG